MIRGEQFGPQRRIVLSFGIMAGLIALASCSTSVGSEPHQGAAADLDPILIGAGDIAW